MDKGDDVRAADGAAAPAAAALDQPTAPQRVPYDRRFGPAVAAGLMTVAQAAARGNRQVFGEQLARRHGLPLELAFEVADNRVSAAEAVRGRRSGRVAPGSAEGRSNPPAPVRPLPRELFRQSARAEVRHRPWRAILGIGLALSLAAVAVRGDPGAARYHKARTLVADFERGRSPLLLDYDAPVYRQALAELARIGDRSRFARRGSEYAAEIQGKIEAHHDRRRTMQQEIERNGEAREQRREAFAEARHQARIAALTAVPECEQHGH